MATITLYNAYFSYNGTTDTTTNYQYTVQFYTTGWMPIDQKQSTVAGTVVDLGNNSPVYCQIITQPSLEGYDLTSISFRGDYSNVQWYDKWTFTIYPKNNSSLGINYNFTTKTSSTTNTVILKLYKLTDNNTVLTQNPQITVWDGYGTTAWKGGSITSSDQSLSSGYWQSNISWNSSSGWAPTYARFQIVSTNSQCIVPVSITYKYTAGGRDYQSTITPSIQQEDNIFYCLVDFTNFTAGNTYNIIFNYNTYAYCSIGYNNIADSYDNLFSQASISPGSFYNYDYQQIEDYEAQSLSFQDIPIYQISNGIYQQTSYNSNSVKPYYKRIGKIYKIARPSSQSSYLTLSHSINSRFDDLTLIEYSVDQNSSSYAGWHDTYGAYITSSIPIGHKVIFTPEYTLYLKYTYRKDGEAEAFHTDTTLKSFPYNQDSQVFSGTYSVYSPTNTDPKVDYYNQTYYIDNEEKKINIEPGSSITISFGPSEWASGEYFTVLEFIGYLKSLGPFTFKITAPGGFNWSDCLESTFITSGYKTSNSSSYTPLGTTEAISVIKGSELTYQFEKSVENVTSLTIKLTIPYNNNFLSGEYYNVVSGSFTRSNTEGKVNANVEFSTNSLAQTTNYQSLEITCNNNTATTTNITINYYYDFQAKYNNDNTTISNESQSSQLAGKIVKITHQPTKIYENDSTSHQQHIGWYPGEINSNLQDQFNSLTSYDSSGVYYTDKSFSKSYTYANNEWTPQVIFYPVYTLKHQYHIKIQKTYDENETKLIELDTIYSDWNQPKTELSFSLPLKADDDPTMKGQYITTWNNASSLFNYVLNKEIVIIKASNNSYLFSEFRDQNYNNFTQKNQHLLISVSAKYNFITWKYKVNYYEPNKEETLEWTYNNNNTELDAAKRAAVNDKNEFIYPITIWEPADSEKKNDENKTLVGWNTLQNSEEVKYNFKQQLSVTWTNTYETSDITKLILYGVWRLGATVWLYTGSQWVQAKPWIFNGSSWVPAIPHIYCDSGKKDNQGKPIYEWR